MTKEEKEEAKRRAVARSVNRGLILLETSVASMIMRPADACKVVSIQ